MHLFLEYQSLIDSIDHLEYVLQYILTAYKIYECTVARTYMKFSTYNLFTDSLNPTHSISFNIPCRIFFSLLKDDDYHLTL